MCDYKVYYNIRIIMNVSQYPPGYKHEKIVGMGMNEDGLKRNSILCAD
jgi:hypothetical protein